MPSRLVFIPPPLAVEVDYFGFGVKPGMKNKNPFIPPAEIIDFLSIKIHHLARPFAPSELLYGAWFNAIMKEMKDGKNQNPYRSCDDRMVRC
jgi:hypothetical protein